MASSLRGSVSCCVTSPARLVSIRHCCPHVRAMGVSVIGLANVAGSGNVQYPVCSIVEGLVSVSHNLRCGESVVLLGDGPCCGIRLAASCRC